MKEFRYGCMVLFLAAALFLCMAAESGAQAEYGDPAPHDPMDGCSADYPGDCYEIPSLQQYPKEEMPEGQRDDDGLGDPYSWMDELDR